jgi:hypothetical protein
MKIANFVIKNSKWILLIALFVLIAVIYVIPEDKISTSLEIVITIISAIFISVVIVKYTYTETKKLERDEYFRLLYNEIDLIKTKIPLIADQIQELKPKWKAFEKEKWIYEKHPVLWPYSQNTRFFYQYLPNNSFNSIINRGFARDIKGFDPKSKDQQFHFISLFYLNIKNASELSERIEDYINACIDNKPTDGKPSKFFKSHELVFKWIDSNIIQFTDTNEIDEHGNYCSFRELLWDEYVDEKCNEIIEIFDNLKSKIDTRISNYHSYQEFSQDVIVEEEDISLTNSFNDKKTNIGIFWPIYAFLFLILILIFPMLYLYPVSDLFLLFVIAFVVIIAVTIYRSLIQFRKDPSKKNLTKILFFILIIWLSFQIVAIGCVEIELLNTKSQYAQEYSSYLERNNGDELGATWNVVNIYFTNFNGTYGVKNAVIPSRRLYQNYIPFLTPLFDIYYFYFDGINKLILIQKGGNCGEFSQSIVLLLNISTNHETRSVSMQGIDHGFPEVKIYNTWWIVDKVYLTPDKPILSINFSRYSSPDLNEDIANLESSSNENNVLEQHGYSITNLSITVIQSGIANHLDDQTQENAAVEVFLISDSTLDPLIAKKNTDKLGNCSFNLRGDKKYLLMAKKDNMVGLKVVDLLPLENQSNIVYLRKYE